MHAKCRKFAFREQKKSLSQNWKSALRVKFHLQLHCRNFCTQNLHSWTNGYLTSKANVSWNRSKKSPKKLFWMTFLILSLSCTRLAVCLVMWVSDHKPPPGKIYEIWPSSLSKICAISRRKKLDWRTLTQGRTTQVFDQIIEQSVKKAIKNFGILSQKQ